MKERDYSQRLDSRENVLFDRIPYALTYFIEQERAGRGYGIDGVGNNCGRENRDYVW